MKINKNLFFPLSLVLLELGVYMSTDAYLPALPSIANHLKTSGSLSQLTISIWFLGGASIQLFLGPITDRYGRKPMVLYGSILFLITSLLCANTSNIYAFIVFRFFQGCTVASTITGGYAAIHESFNSKKAMQILATMGSITILAPAIGPLLGALIIHYTESWRYIFIVLTIWGLLGTILIYKNMPETLKAPTEIHFKKNLMSYKDIIINNIWRNYALMSSCLIFGFFVWLITSPFLLMVHYQFSTIQFGIAQAIIFSGFIGGMQLCKWLLNNKPLPSIILLFLTINSSATITLLLLSFAQISSGWLVVSLMALVAFGASGANTPLSRLAFESSDSPSGQKVSLYSLVFTISATIATYTGSISNSLNLTSVISISFIGYAIACILFYKNRKNIILHED